MASERTFHWARIRNTAGTGRIAPGGQYRAAGYQPLLEVLRQAVYPAIEQAGGRLWGTWLGLFGLRNNELIVATSWDSGADPAGVLTDLLPAAAKVMEQYTFVPTVRPESDAPLTRDGLYVFRFFDVRTPDVEQVATLSNEAWTTFENTAAYQAEPQALFKEREPAPDRSTMLLLTWYDGFASWETSRTPAPEARDNFRRRAELTLGAFPIATRLCPAD
ncbi:MAG: hypothetical protein KC495_03870 [Dehalococcoidia bacterium]|nr:hypothetical protein [Dehalococcoidia bacterium]